MGFSSDIVILSLEKRLRDVVVEVEVGGGERNKCLGIGNFLESRF